MEAHLNFYWEKKGIIVVDEIFEVWGRKLPALLSEIDFSSEKRIPLQCSIFLPWPK